MSKKYIAIVMVFSLLVVLFSPIFAYESEENLDEPIEEVIEENIDNPVLDENFDENFEEDSNSDYNPNDDLDLDYSSQMPLVEFSDYFKLEKNSDGPNTYTVVDYTSNIYTNNVAPELDGKIVTRIGPGAFKDKNQICGEIKIPDTVIEIADSAFEGCSTISSIILGTNTKVIGTKAFYNCTSLATIEFNQKLESIGAYCFYKDTKLSGKSFEIPKTVNFVGNYAFYNTGIVNLTFVSKNAPTIEKNTFAGMSSLKLKVPHDGVGYTIERNWPVSKIDSTLYGDVNLDGKINSTDAALVLELYANQSWTTTQLKYGDMDGDGKLNSSDAVRILEIF